MGYNEDDKNDENDGEDDEDLSLFLSVINIYIVKLFIF